MHVVICLAVVQRPRHTSPLLSLPPSRPLPSSPLPSLPLPIHPPPLFLPLLGSSGVKPWKIFVAHE